MLKSTEIKEIVSHINEAFTLDDSCFTAKSLKSSSSIQSEYVKSNKLHSHSQKPVTERVQTSVKNTILDAKFIFSQEKQVKHISWTQIFGTMLCASVQLSVGVSVAFTGVTLPAMMDPNTNDLVLSKSQASIFNAIVNFGSMAGSLCSCFVMTWIGQRSTLLILLPIGMVSWVMQYFDGYFWILVVARLLQGLCLGVASPCSMNYVVEFAHKTVRGKLFGALMISLQLGILIVYIVGSTNLSWRKLCIVCGTVPMVIPFIGFFFIPHSPRWLAYNGRMEEAKEAMAYFRGPHYDVTPEINEIILQASKTRGKISVKSQLCKLQDTSILRRFLVISVLLFASNFTGNWVLVNYAVSLFESANVSIDSYLSSILVALTRTIGVAIYLIIGDKIGRRALFIIPIFLTGVSMSLLGIFFYLKLMQFNTSFLFWLPLFSLASFHLFTCIANPGLKLLQNELLPNSVRALGVGLSNLTFYSGSFFAALTYPVMVDSIGSHCTFWIYGSVSILMALIAAIFIPETSGKTLEEINDIFRRKSIIGISYFIIYQ